jgi:inorganic triphosphatase YgiF
MDGKEIELKLATEPGTLARVRRHPAVAPLLQGPVRRTDLLSEYFDTSTLELAAAGLCLRVRHRGRGRVQTLKTEGDRATGLFRRDEWEAPAPGDRPTADFLAASGLAAVADPALAERLRPVFATRIRRTTALLAGPDWQAELALDSGEIIAGADRRPICEIELELRAGPPARLHELARALAADLPVRLQARSKSDRGYALAAAAAPAPVKARAVALAEEMTAAEAFQAIGRACLAHLLANQEALLAGDGEAVHQMRVALRRLRSAVKVFAKVVGGPKSEGARDGIRWLLGHLGPARDADVFLDEMLEPARADNTATPGMAELAAHWRRCRDVDREAARAAVASSRFTTLLLDLGAWVEGGDWIGGKAGGKAIVPFAAKALAKSHRRMLKAGDGRLAALAPAELHQVRILGKQMRYTAEFFSALLPHKKARPFVAGLAELQDRLGGINDIATAVHRLESSPAPLRTAAVAVAAWHAARRARLLADADRAWKGWRKLPVPWDGLD